MYESRAIIVISASRVMMHSRKHTRTPSCEPYTILQNRITDRQFYLCYRARGSCKIDLCRMYSPQVKRALRGNAMRHGTVLCNLEVALHKRFANRVQCLSARLCEQKGSAQGKVRAMLRCGALGIRVDGAQRECIHCMRRERRAEM